MIGDLWESPQTGRIYEVGEPGARWRTVGQADGNVIQGALVYLGAVSGLAVLANAWVATMVGLLLGTALIYLPAVLPLTVPLALLAFLVVAIRAVITRRRLGSVALTGLMVGAFLVIAVLNAVLWHHSAPNAYQAVAALPIMAALAAAAGVALLARTRVAAGLLFLAQAVVFALPYLATIGGNLRFSESTLGYDNVLSLVSWMFCALLLTSWISPRRQTRPEAAINL